MRGVRTEWLCIEDGVMNLLRLRVTELPRRRSIQVSEMCLLSVGMNDGIDSLSKWKVHQLIEMVKILIESVNGVGLVVHRVCKIAI